MDQLANTGWMVVPGLDDVEMRASQLALELGHPQLNRNGVPLVERLIPQESLSARPRTLSGRHGLAAFPWHVDGAHKLKLPRYIILGCHSASPDAAMTDLADLTKCSLLSNSGLFTEPFKVRNGSRSFYATMRDRGRQFTRHDPGCMTALTSEGTALQARFSELTATHALHWQPGMVVILDNWRCLHRRGSAFGDTDRVLIRVTVYEP